MQFSLLKTEVENRTGSHTRTGDFINAGQLELAKEAQNLEKASITFTSGVASIPATCLEVISILWDDIPIDGPKPQYMYVWDGTADPTEWTIKNGQILLNTKITETQTNGLLYVPRPATLTLDPDIPALTDSDNALIAYARYMIYTDLENAERAKYWWNQWQEKKAEWVKGHKKRNPRPHMIKMHRSTRRW